MYNYDRDKLDEAKLTLVGRHGVWIGHRHPAHGPHAPERGKDLGEPEVMTPRGCICIRPWGRAPNPKYRRQGSIWTLAGMGVGYC